MGWEGMGFEAQTSDSLVVLGQGAREVLGGRDRALPGLKRQDVIARRRAADIENKGRIGIRPRNRFDASFHIASSQGRVVPSE